MVKTIKIKMTKEEKKQAAETREYIRTWYDCKNETNKQINARIRKTEKQ